MISKFYANNIMLMEQPYNHLRIPDSKSAKDDVFTLTDNLQEFEWSEEMKSGPDTIVSKFFFQKSLVDSIGSRDSIPDSEDFFERVGKS